MAAAELYSYSLRKANKVDISVDFPGGARVDARFGFFTVHTDQPKAEGGEDTAPTPFELFLASLATCAGYYVIGFCKARNISAEGIRLIQKDERNSATKMIEKILIEIQLPPGFPKEYEAAVIRAAGKCFVKKHLEHPPTFAITVAGDSSSS
jgi:ribosomal protein S12 methylthiotransferase accessory factor